MLGILFFSVGFLVGSEATKLFIPDLKILGAYSSSCCLPKAEDYDRKCKDLERQWEVDTKIALQKERMWRTKITTKNQKKINYWRKFASPVKCKVIQDEATRTIENYDSS